MHDPKNRQKFAIWTPSHNLSRYIFATKAHVDNRKKLVKQQYLPHMSSQHGELRPSNSWHLLASLGHSSKFQRVSRLGALLHGTLVGGVSQTSWRWTDGATYIRQGGHHVGHRSTFLVTCVLRLICFWCTYDVKGSCTVILLTVIWLPCFLWPPCITDAALYFCPVVSIFLLSFFFFPRLISAVADWVSTILPHTVWP